MFESESYITTDEQSVCLGVKPPSGVQDQIFITVRQLRVCWCGALSLTRRRVCRLQLLLAFASAVILGSKSRGTRDQSRFTFSSPHGYGGGIQPHLHTVSTVSQSESHIATDGQAVSKSWCRAPSGAHDQLFITVWQLQSCYCGAPSLTGGKVCLLSESLSAIVSHLS
jgi:hypothetical protein